VFKQDESRAKDYKFYTHQLEKRLKDEGNVDFMKNFKPQMNRFVHSGFACKKSYIQGVTDANSVKKVFLFLMIEQSNKELDRDK